MRGLVFDTVLNNFSEINIREQTCLPIIAIYKHPRDYPGQYVARLWDIDKPTHYIVLNDNIDSLRQIKPLWMTILMPTERDDPVLVETWL